MEKNVYGVFDSNPELLAAISNLKAKGVSGTQMTVAADIKNYVQLGNEHTDILIIANQDKEDTLFLKSSITSQMKDLEIYAAFSRNTATLLLRQKRCLKK